MIRLGLDEPEKAEVVRQYVADHGITRVVMISPARFRWDCPGETILWEQVIEYVYYYRLLQEIDGSTLVVLNECLRTQNRHDLTYNCIRQYLNQTKHQIVFQYLPLIDTVDDLMILVDFDTRSRWRRQPFAAEHLVGLDIAVRRRDLTIHPVLLPVDAAVRVAYDREKRARIDGIGLKDPHTIPRNLHLMSGRTKVHAPRRGEYLIGRNSRFKLPGMHAYKADAYPQGQWTVFDWCHNFVDFADFLALARPSEVDALVADLPVDRWYLRRFTDWMTRISDAYAAVLTADGARRCA